MNGKKLKTITFTVILIFLFMGLDGFHLSRGEDVLNSSCTIDKEYVNELKNQIKNELKKELQTRISQDVTNNIKDLIKEELAIYLKSNPDLLAYQKNDNIPDIDQPVTKQELIRKMLQEQLADLSESLNDVELDRYVASGGTQPEAKVAQSYSKTSSPTKVSKTRSTTKLDDNDQDETTAGEKIESIEKTLVQKGSVLIPKGKLQIEPSTTYAHFSSNRINIDGFTIYDVVTIGEISTDTIKRDILMQNLAFKYGLLHNFQVDVRIPYRYEFDRITNSSSSESTRSTNGLGDISMSVSRQIGWDNGFWPDVIGNISIKTNSGKSSYNRAIGLGTGHWAITGGLVATKASDPAFVFGSVNYSYSIPREFENFGEVKPGSTIGYSIGTAIALSYQTAINFSFDHSLTFKMQQAGIEVPGSFLNSANFKTGFNWSFNENASMDFSLSMGLTTDAPDYTVEVRFPYSF